MFRLEKGGMKMNNLGTCRKCTKGMMPGAAVFTAALLLAASSMSGVRPYEFEWANRTKDDRPVLLPLVSADGWTATAMTPGASATLTTGVERVLFGDGVMHLGYRLPEKSGRIVLRLVESVPLAPGFDTVSVWLYGNHINSKWAKHPAVPVFLYADFLDSAGKPFTLLVHRFNHAEWFLAQKRLTPAFAERVKDGGRFVGFTLRGGPDEHERWIELMSFAAFRDELKPLSFKPRRKRGVQVFKNAPQGLNTGEGRLPFPNVETTIIPIVAEDPNIEFRFPKDPANWDDLAVRWRGHAGRMPLSESNSTVGSRVPRDRNATGTGSEDGWFYFARGGGLFPASAAKGAKIRFHRVANSLIADIEAPAGVEEVRFGNLAEPKGAKFFPLPYYTCGANGDGLYRRPCVVATETGETTLFHLASVDWTQSNASWPFPPDAKDEPPAGSNGGVRYLAKTDGERNPVFERFVWSFSTEFDDVLPVIPNPPSPYRAVTAGRAWSVMFANNRDRDKAYWRKRHRRGIRFLCVNDHENCFRDGNESFTFRTRPAPKKGGDEGFRDFTRFMTDELGYLYGPYNNYTDFAPVNEWWNADRVSRRQDGNLQTAWNRCYAPKPAFINEACEVIWTELQRKFRFNTAYCDVHTCVTPWSRTDYDARVPGAGTFAATFYSFGELLDFERRVLGGPVYSEGQCHYMYCGLVDGNYAQDQKAKLPEAPWLVDFDLLRMHPLSNNFGMGNLNMFYAEGVWKPDLLQDRVDRFLAATAAFGHQAFLVKDNEESEEQSYFMVLGVARHWCTADAKDIRYMDRDGRLLRTSEAVVSGAHRRSQVAVTYADGTVVFANGSTNDEMSVAHRRQTLSLNPNGFFAFAGDGTAFAALNAKRDGGGRIDVSVAPDYAYLNAYGKLADTPFGATDGRMYRLVEKDGTEEVFLRKGTTFILPYAAESVVALDDDGQEIGSAPFGVEDGRTRLSPRKGALSFRVKKPHAPRAEMSPPLPFSW